MPVFPPISTLDAGGGMQRDLRMSHFSDRATMKTPRPISTATEIFDTDAGNDDDVDDDDDNDSEFEEYSNKSSFESDASRRRSQTTLSSYGEMPTPDCNLLSQPFDLQIKPVEGPRGPHLFRSSQSSTELAWDHALQMSPLLPKKFDLSTSQRQAQRIFASPEPLTRPVETPSHAESDPHSIIRCWNTAQVADWMISWNIEPAIARCFEKHDINGAVLLDLQFDDLRELDIESFGKRHHLWNAICTLRGDDDSSPRQSLSQEVIRPSTRNSARPAATHACEQSSSSEEADVDVNPVVERKKRRGRSSAAESDTILLGESAVSIVAIEQLLPKPHNCSKGADCPKWRKQQRYIQRLRDENGIGCFTLDPSINKSRHVSLQAPYRGQTPASLQIPKMPVTPGLKTSQTGISLGMSTIVPSVVASSDLLGPGQLPEFALHAGMLDKVEKRDPQDNVRNFLNFQHMNSPKHIPTNAPSHAADSADSGSLGRSQSVPPVPAMFPAQHYQPFPSLSQNVNPGQDDRLKGLPQLDIPRSATVVASVDRRPSGVDSPSTISFYRTATASPINYRLGTPASEMDVPLTTVPVGVVARNASQSVPPDMQYRQQTQSPPRPTNHRNPSLDWRRPSLPAVREGEVFIPAKKPELSAMSKHISQDSTSTCSSKGKTPSTLDPSHHSPVTREFGYGADCSHAGFMKKRRTKMLRHEWHEAHFRLMGTQLNMHDSARLGASLKDSINVDEYAVACSSVPSNSKLTAAMRAFNIKNQDSSKSTNGKEADPTPFAFQLVPTRDGSPKKFAAAAHGKTHHFAVKTKDDRIDWMREIMLAKALQQRGKGYEVEINGEAA